MNREIKNPQRRTLMAWIMLDIVFIIAGLKSFLYFNINSADGMIILISLLVLITSLFFIPQTIKNCRRIDAAIHNGEQIVCWTYTKKEWQEYILHEKDYRLNEGKLIALFLYVITTVVFIPFILFIPEGKLAMFVVMLLLFFIYTFMGFVFPKMVFLLRKKRIGKVILLKQGLLIDRQFHTWDFPLSSFSYAEHKKKPYDHLAISYDFFDRTGPRTYTVNVPIPKNNKKNITSIIAGFK